MTSDFVNEVTRRIADFLTEIGIEVKHANISEQTFLPGILVANGRILVDETKMTYPGDLLHEAGHLALAPAQLRSSLSGEVVLPGVRMEPVEAAAMAWSFAALLKLNLDPQVVFHDGGYRGESKELLLNFSLGVYIGVSGLQEAGLTVTGAKAVELGLPAYPHMIKWLRD